MPKFRFPFVVDESPLLRQFDAVGAIDDIKNLKNAVAELQEVILELINITPPSKPQVSSTPGTASTSKGVRNRKTKENLAGGGK